MSQPSRVLIADDHALFRDGLKLILTEMSDGLDVVEASSYPDALAKSREDDLDLALVDLSMPGMERFAGLSALIRSLKDVPVVVVSAAETMEEMSQAMDCGAHGYIPKTQGNDVVLNAVQQVLNGEIYLPPALIGWQPGSNGNGSSAPSLHLTPRQRDVLNLMAEGKSNKEIARILGLAEGTVKLHVTGLLKVLDVNNRTQAVIKATSMGLAVSSEA